LDGRLALPKNTLLDGSYRIERIIGSGGFGITYEAEDIHLETKVAIKEYYPEEFGQRDASLRVRPTAEKQKVTFDWGRTSFLQEARTLARFRHPSVVQVTRVFEANSTAYMVMVFEEGQTFEAWLKRLGRAPTQEELDRIVWPLLGALEMIHAENFLHRDIAPDNIIVRADVTPVLLDFGSARRAVAERSRALTGIVKAGYSPHEQYSTDSRLQGPWSDIYALGGTLYRAVSGQAPEEATLRVDQDRTPPAAEIAKETYRPGFLAAIDACLKVRYAERPQSVAQLRPMLCAPGHFLTRPRVETRKTGTTKPTLVPAARGSTKSWWAVAAVIAVVSGGLFGGLQYARWDAEVRGRVEAEARRKAEQDLQRQTDAAAAIKKAGEEAQARAEAQERRRAKTIEDCQYKSGDDAIAACNEAIRDDPTNANLYNYRGIEYRGKGEFDRAIVDYTKAIEIDPRHAKAYYNRGLIYANRKELDRAIADYTKAIEINPKYANAYFNRGFIYDDRKEFDRALVDYTKAIEIDPRDAKAYYNRGLIYANRKEIDRAIADYTKAIEIDPRYAKAYFNRGFIYDDRKELDRAIADYTKAIEIDPRDAKAYYNRGLIYANRKEIEHAIADYTKAIEIDPRHAKAYYNRGNLYDDGKEFNRAIADYTNAIEIDPRDAKAYNNRGLAYEHKGNRARAIADYRKALEVDPASQSPKTNLKRLKAN